MIGDPNISRQAQEHELTRSADPATSHEAAAWVFPKLNKLQNLVWDWVCENPRFIDKELVAAMQAKHGGSESTWRTRRSELRDNGLLYAFSVRQDVRGKGHTVWARRPEK